MNEDTQIPNINQLTVAQHYVPRFYLKRFGNDQNILERLSLLDKKFKIPKGPGGLCNQEYFYALFTGQSDEMSQQIETALRIIESHISRNYDLVMKELSSQKHVSDSAKMTVVQMMSMLWIRVPEARKWLEETKKSATLMFVENYMGSEDYKASLVEIQKQLERPLTSNEQLEVEETLKNADLYPTNLLHLRHLARFEGYANIFFHKNLNVYLAKGKRKFITSDNPVFEWVPESTYVGARNILLRRQYMALTPTIMVESYYYPQSKDVKRKSLFDNEKDDWFIQWFNLEQANKCSDQCFSPTKYELEMILPFANNNLRFNYEKYPWFEKF